MLVTLVLDPLIWKTLFQLCIRQITARTWSPGYYGRWSNVARQRFAKMALFADSTDEKEGNEEKAKQGTSTLPHLSCAPCSWELAATSHF